MSAFTAVRHPHGRPAPGDPQRLGVLPARHDVERRHAPAPRDVVGLSPPAIDIQDPKVPASGHWTPVGFAVSPPTPLLPRVQPGQAAAPGQDSLVAGYQPVSVLGGGNDNSVDRVGVKAGQGRRSDDPNLSFTWSTRWLRRVRLRGLPPPPPLVSGCPPSSRPPPS